MDRLGEFMAESLPDYLRSVPGVLDGMQRTASAPAEQFNIAPALNGFRPAAIRRLFAGQYGQKNEPDTRRGPAQ